MTRNLCLWMLVLAVAGTGLADSLNVRLVGTYTLPSAFPIDVAVVDSFAYIAAAHAGLRIVSIANPQSPAELGFSTAMANAIGVAVQDSIAYVAGHFGGVFLVNVADPHNPTLVGQRSTPAAAARVAVKDTFLYVANRDAGLRVLSVANPANPYEVGFCDTLAFYENVEVVDTIAYVSGGLANLFLTINVASPASPTLAGYLALPSNGQGLAVSGSHAYVTAGDMLIIDVSDPANPREVGRYVSPSFAGDVRVAGDVAFVADGYAGLRVVDVSNPQQPQEVGYYDTPGYANGIDLAGDYICVTEDPVGMRIFQFLGAGVEETPNAGVRSTNGGAVIVRGVLWLGGAGQSQCVGRTGLRDSPCAALLDAAGRNVLDLRPGANDVRRLSPGVYFIREDQAQAQAQAVRKVVVTGG